MNFLSKLFGKGKSQDLIEVQNKWGVTPLVVERHPDLERIFSDSDPQPPQRIVTEMDRDYWQRQDKEDILRHLGMAYLSHPDPQIRAATIPYIKHFKILDIANALADLLADPSSDVRYAAVRAIWERAVEPDPDNNSVAFTIRILRDEIQRTGFTSHMSPQEALQALELLQSARPDRRNDFNKWMIYAWCRSDEDLAEHGYKLLDIFSQHGTFLDAGTQATGKIGAEIGSARDREDIQVAIQATLGDKAANELEAVWKDDLKVYIEVLKKNGDVDGLIGALNYKELILRGMAAEALGDIGDLRAVSALQSILDEAERAESSEILSRFNKFVPDSLRAEQDFVRQKAKEALDRIHGRAN